MPEDFISMDLQDALASLGEITGESVDGEIIDRIFTRFYHSQSPAEGSTGLGLAIVSSICRNYGLSVEYRFEAGRHVFSIKTDKKHHNF